MEYFNFCNTKAVSEQEINQLEKKFDFKMPSDMKSFYIEHNGASLEKCIIHGEDLELREFHPIAYQWNKHILTIDTLLDWQKTDGFIPMNFIPFCADVSGDDYYIRVDSDGYGKIYYIFSEFEDSFLENPDDYIVADSFTEFLNKIEPYCEGI